MLVIAMMWKGQFDVGWMVSENGENKYRAPIHKVFGWQNHSGFFSFQTVEP